jgi:hypothetical protein
MTTATCRDLHPQTWKDLYHTAISESDLTKLPDRITDAESALVMRARDLFYASGDKEIDEEESLDYAMCILHALRSSLKRRATAVQKTSNSADPRSA